MKRLIAILTLLSLFQTVQADDWPNWRGPNFNGVANGDSYPVSWTAERNIKWKAKLPEFGSSTPAVWGESIFVTTPDGGKNSVLCFNLDGRKQWETSLGEVVDGKHKMGSGSNPSPVTDGEHVWVYFKSGDFGCLDFNGKIIWQTNLQTMFGDDTLWWDLGTSPVLTKKHVVVACMQDGPSYVAAFDKESGKLAWKQDRNTGAPIESDQSYTTPIVTMIDGREEVIVLGADFVTAHDATSGKETWRVGGLNPDNAKMWRSIASPVLADGTLYAPYARGKTLTAIKVGGKGDRTKQNTLWTKKGISIDVPTPAVKDGKVFICNDQGKVECIDPNSGKTIWDVALTTRRRGKFYSSPIIAGNHLYVIREDGTTFVVNIKSQKVVSENPLGKKIAASPVFVNGTVLIRAADGLYCIE